MSNRVARSLLTKLNLFPGKTTRAPDLISLVNAMRVTPIKQNLIRIGPDRDGGYLLPDDFEGIKYCFSPGVGDCSDFELDLAKRGLKIFLADRSVEKPSIDHSRFHFLKKYIASTNSPKEGLITLDEWYRQELETASDHSPEALLQMDIEGCEYEVLHNVSELLLKRFRIIVVEFHKLYQLTDRFSFNWMSKAFRKILSTHAVVHIHPNNNRTSISYRGIEIPSTIEITFLRRDRVQREERKLAFPHPLDRRCIETKADLILPSCWYS